MKGGHPNTMAAMRKAHEQWIKDNPEKARAMSIANLPKDCNGEKNGNWRGGRTEARTQWRKKNGYKLKVFRKEILQRDNYTCRNCGSKDQPQLHHIISMTRFPQGAFNAMNAVILCKECHCKTDDYCGRGNRTKVSIGKTIAVLATIPEKWHPYDTAGNWSLCEDAILCFASDCYPEESVLAILLHELVEAVLSKKAGISEKKICDFDTSYEAKRSQGHYPDDAEPGDHPDSPYRLPHQAATFVERAVCSALEISWADHERIISE